MAEKSELCRARPEGRRGAEPTSTLFSLTASAPQAPCGDQPQLLMGSKPSIKVVFIKECLDSKVSQVLVRERRVLGGSLAWMVKLEAALSLQ